MTTDQLSSVFSALADPIRRALLARLREGEATVTELARPFDVTLPAISRHLRVLADAGLVERGRAAQWRPCRLRAGPLREASEWLTDYRVFWETSLDRLAEHLQDSSHTDHHTDHQADEETAGVAAPPVTTQTRPTTEPPGTAGPPGTTEPAGDRHREGNQR